jgi:hypothetical protein
MTSKLLAARGSSKKMGIGVHDKKKTNIRNKK